MSPCQSEDDGVVARQLSKPVLGHSVPYSHQDFSQPMKPVHLQPRAVKRSRPVALSAALQLPPVHHGVMLSSDTSTQPCTPGQLHPGVSLTDRPRPGHTGAKALATPCRTPGLSSYCPSAGALLLGVRLSISSPNGSRTGKVVDVQGTGGKHLVRFDDSTCEWLSLPHCSWRWHTPRAKSAGLTPALCQALRKMGAANLAPEPQPPLAPPTGVRLTANPTQVVGQQLWLWCAASGSWHAGVVVAASQAGSGAHHVVYQQDGSDEWVKLNQEVVLWAVPEGAMTKHICPPLLAGLSPTGMAAVNRRVGVYWREDQSFWEGTVTKYLAGSGEHQVVYDDGEEEVVRLHDDVVIWRCQATQHQARHPPVKPSIVDEGTGRQQRQRINTHQPLHQPTSATHHGHAAPTPTAVHTSTTSTTTAMIQSHQYPTTTANGGWPVLRQQPDSTDACRSVLASPPCGPALPGVLGCVSSA